MKKLLIAGCLALFGQAILTAQDSETLSLEQAINYAMENNFSIRNAQVNIADAEEQIVERRSFGLPRLDGSVNYNYFVQLPASLIPAQAFDPNAPEGEFTEVAFGTRNDLQLGLSLTTLVFDGSYFVGLRAAKAYRQYVDRELIAKRQEVTNAVRDAYLPALIIQQTRNTLVRNLGTIDKLLTETKALYREGFVEQLDVDRLELSKANLETSINNLDREAQLVYNVLKFQMGYPLDREVVASDEIEQLLVPATAEELTAEVDYGSRPEYQVLGVGEQLSQLNIDLNRAGYLPSLAAFANYRSSVQGDNLFDDPFFIPSFIVGFQLQVPIFDGFEKRAKVNRAKLELTKLQNQRSDLERAIELEVANARTSYSSAQSRVDDERRNLNLAEKIYNTTQIKYREGVGSSLELVQAEQSLFSTQQSHIQAIYELLLAKIALDKALGK
ncbi:MAG: TolC family protein [Bacteroidota bacterium]